MPTVRISPRDYWRLLAVYLKPQRRLVALLALLLFATTALQLVSPLILRQFIDRALDGTALNTLLLIAGPVSYTHLTLPTKA